MEILRRDARLRIGGVLTSLLVTCLLMSGCGERVLAAGRTLAKAGVDTSQTLADYYASLIQDTVDTWELEAFDASLRKVSLDTHEQNQLSTQIRALSARVTLARKLRGMYQVLLDEASSNVPSGAKDAATDLGGALTKVVKLPNGTDPSPILGTIASDLVELKQAQSVEKNSKVLLDSARKISELFCKETSLYRSIAVERQNKIGNVTDYLIKNQLVVSWSLLQTVSDGSGLKWVKDEAPATDATTIAALKEVAKARAYRLTLASEAAADGVATALATLIDNHKAFLSGQPVSLQDVLAALQKARGYVDEIQQLRAPKKSAGGSNE